MNYRTAREWVSQEAAWLIPVISQTSATGTTTSLIDTALWQNPGSNYLTPKQAAGWHILFPGSSGDQRARRVSGTTPGNLSTGALSWDGPALSGNVAAGARYELSVRPPLVMYNTYVKTLREFLLPDLSPLPVYPDADMEDAGVSNHTLVGAGSLAKDTTPGNVYSGSQSLLFTAGAASDYLEEPTVIVKPGASYFGSAIVRVQSGTFSFAVWDKTNDREIGSRVWTSMPGFMSLQRTIQVPPDCKQIAFRIYCSSASDVASIDCLHGPYKADDYVLNAPTFLTKPSLLRKVLEARYTAYEEHLFDASSRAFTQWYPRDYFLRTNTHHANPYRFELRRGLPMAEVWIETIRKGTSVYAPEFSPAGETSPNMNIDEDLFCLSYLANLCREILSFIPDDKQAAATLASILQPVSKGGRGLNDLLAEYARSLESPLLDPPYPVQSMRAL